MATYCWKSVFFFTFPTRKFLRAGTGFSVSWFLPHTRPMWANYAAASPCKIGRFPERVLRISRELNTWLITVASMRLMQKSCKSNPAINHPTFPTHRQLQCPPSFSFSTIPTMVENIKWAGFDAALFMHRSGSAATVAQEELIITVFLCTKERQ